LLLRCLRGVTVGGPFSYVALVLGGTAGFVGCTSISSSDVDTLSTPTVFRLLVEYDCFFLFCSDLLILLCELIVGRINLDTFFSASLSESDWFSTPLDLLLVIAALFFAYLDPLRDALADDFFPETGPGAVSGRTPSRRGRKLNRAHAGGATAALVFSKTDHATRHSGRSSFFFLGKPFAPGPLLTLIDLIFGCHRLLHAQIAQAARPTQTAIRTAFV
jgi:hypothetical protein